MPIANPVSSPDDLPADPIFTEEQLAHAKRPVEADWGELTEREYRDVNTGKETPANQTVPADQAASDLARLVPKSAKPVRLRATATWPMRSTPCTAGDRPAPQQPAQQDQQQPELDGVQPEYQVDPAEAAARAEVDGAWQKADEQITEFLKDPHIRERIQGEYDQVKNAAAAEAKAEVERAYNLSAAVQQPLPQATNESR